jgi:tetratricopeptide (TPR) repeat protein
VHRLAAAAGADPAAAVDVALRAGRHCTAEPAYEEAAAMAARALEALGDGGGPLHADALLLLGEASLRSGDEPAAGEAFARAADIARRVEDAGRLARAALGASGLGVTIIAVREPTVELLREALAALPEAGALRARVLARLAVETYYASAPPDRKAVGDEAVEHARRAGDPAALVAALNARHVALRSAGYLDERLETATTMVAAASAAGDVEGELQGRNWRVADLLELGEIEAAREDVDRHEQLADRVRLEPAAGGEAQRRALRRDPEVGRRRGARARPARRLRRPATGRPRCRSDCSRRSRGVATAPARTLTDAAAHNTAMGATAWAQRSRTALDALPGPVARTSV